MRDVFGILCTCFCFREEILFFDWFELVELLRLYLGALLCWVTHVRGSIFCDSCFKLLIDL